MSLDAYDLWCACGGAIRPVRFMYRGAKCERCEVGYLLILDDEGVIASAKTSPTIERMIATAERSWHATYEAFERASDGERVRFLDSNVAKELRSKGIRAEVEAMDWPDEIDA